VGQIRRLWSFLLCVPTSEPVVCVCSTTEKRVLTDRGFGSEADGVRYVLDLDQVRSLFFRALRLGFRIVMPVFVQ
jgi:hypothetical protein